MILKQPIVTEKSTLLGEKLNRVQFKVDKKANKIEIKKAVEELYGVRVIDVNTIIQRGKTKNRQTKAGTVQGRTNSYKKAIITLAEGESIDIYAEI
jgi:large subunit ribosomal protein L23